MECPVSQLIVKHVCLQAKTPKSTFVPMDTQTVFPLFLAPTHGPYDQMERSKPVSTSDQSGSMLPMKTLLQGLECVITGLCLKQKVNMVGREMLVLVVCRQSGWKFEVENLLR